MEIIADCTHRLLKPALHRAACETGQVPVSQTAMSLHNSRARYISFASYFTCGFIICVLIAGCKTPSCSEQNFARGFDAKRVAELARDSYKVAWAAQYWARYDLRFGVYHPTALDREAVYYLNHISRKVHWIANDVEKNPATPRCSSKASYDIVAFDAKMLRARYRPDSFRPKTGAQIEQLLQMTDEISSYYELKSP